MVRALLATASLSFAAVGPAAAESGYAYPFTNCMQEVVEETLPNICEAAIGAAQKYLIITSTVIDTARVRDQLVRFREGARRKLDLDIEGQISPLAPTRAAAEEALAANRQIEGDAIFIGIELSVD